MLECARVCCAYSTLCRLIRTHSGTANTSYLCMSCGLAEHCIWCVLLLLTMCVFVIVVDCVCVCVCVGVGGWVGECVGMWVYVSSSM